MYHPAKRPVAGLARPIVVGIIVVLATAVVIFAYGFLTRQGPVGLPPKSLPTMPLPRTDVEPATKIPAPPPEKKSPETTGPPAPKDALFYEPFAAKDPFASGKWIATRDGDFKEAIVDTVSHLQFAHGRYVPIEDATPTRGRLRIRVGTVGTRDDTVKHLGIRTAKPVLDLTQGPLELSTEIDWNNQANGCYLQASLFLCPTSTDRTAEKEEDWLKFEYVGVPPGKNARAYLATRQTGNLRELHKEGWPQPDPKDRTGRPIAKQRVTLRLDRDTIAIIENGKPLFGPAPHGCDFQQAYLYLEVLSHSNYPPRELFFGPLLLRPAKPGA
ncbi:MAG: hypothetical protein FJ290_01735 [Planctomycetes bacterium]|nr:hypothetical protein [Planctomycetota bacterium]